MNTCAAPGCARVFNTLLFPERRCPRHITLAQRELLADLDRRAAGVGVKDGLWPYGPNIDVESRARMVEWAEAEGYKLATPRAQCLHWLVGKQRHCVARQDHYHHDGQIDRWTMGALDHPTMWTRDGKPALILGQPYHSPPEGWAEEITAAWPVHVEVAESAPWYGAGTRGVFITPAVKQ